MARMKPLHFAVVLMVCVGIPALADGPVSVEKLDWLAGHWGSSEEGRSVEELWLPASGGMLLAVHREVRPGRTAFYEFIRIEQAPEGPVYVVTPKGQATGRFPLTELDGQRAVFENPDHDFPQRMTYTLREDGRLYVRAEGEQNGRPALLEYVWTRR